MPRSFPGARTYSRSTSLSGCASPRATDPKTDNSAMPYLWHSSARRSLSALISSRVSRVAPSADLRNILRRTQSGTRMHWCAAAADFSHRFPEHRLPGPSAGSTFGRTLAGSASRSVAVESATVRRSSSRTASLRLLTEPASGIGPKDKLITGARSSVELTMYELADPTTEADLAADAARGMDVRVLLDQHLEKSRNTSAYNYLNAHRVH